MVPRLALCAVLLALWWGLPAAQISAPLSLLVSDEGVGQGSVRTIDCTGAGLTCSVSGATATFDASAGGGAPADATYWVKTAHAGLSNEVVLGGFPDGLLTMNSGDPDTYAGSSCTNQFPRSIDSEGAFVCDDLETTDFGTTASSFVLAGPDGPPGEPSFRAIVNGDLPTVAIVKGGTGQVSATAAFDALGPTTTAGDLIYHNGTDNIRLGIGTAGQQLTVNAGATAPQWSSFDTVLTLAGQVSTGANQTLVDLTGMAFTAAAAGLYTFEIHAAVNNAANTTGYGIGINCAQAPQRVWMTGGSQLANTGTSDAWSAIANNAIVGVTSGVPTNGTDVPVFGYGQILANATTAGTCTFRFRSEVNAVARMQAGSVFIVRRVN